VFLGIIGGSVLLYIVSFWVGVARIGGPARAVSNACIDANSVLTDSILNYETVKYFCAEGNVHGRFGAALAKVEDQWAKLFSRKMENGFVLATIFTLSLGISICFATREVQLGKMSVGDFVLVHAYILRISLPLEMIGFAFRDIAQGIGFIEKLAELFGQKQEVDVIGDRASLPTGAPKLSFERVSYSYQPDRRILKSINFVVPSGKTVAIVGASGSGKSSLIRLLVRLLDPTEGQIRLNDVPLSNIPVAALRSAIAVVPQDIALFNDSIAYNIGFGKHDSTETDIVRAAKVAHIHDFIAGLPDGYATLVGERGLKLSGGERQRIAIARAAIKEPKIFVFDEATASLDSNAEQAILYNLIKRTTTATTLIIAHRLSTIAHADEIVVLAQGRVVDRGNHAELLQRHGTYAAMWHAQHAHQGQPEGRLPAV
jgi:ATP-binding cassette subfamily B protein